MKDLEYHTKQYESPKRSTVAFVDWLETFEVLERSNILDMACGGGGLTSSICPRDFPPQRF